MCGIAGFLSAGPARPAQQALAIAGAMERAISHRGPDSGASWADAEAGIALGHRRLAIIDTSPLGAQPMHSHDARFVVAYNGEIYNYRDVRRELDALTPAPAWRGHSDTEVLLEAISRWGLDAALQRCTGMFALALWDRAERTLHLARDRVGEKPLYYGWTGGELLFGSELKALRAHPAWNAAIDREAVGQFMRFGYVPAPRSIFAGIAKLPPGSIVSFTPADAHARRMPQTRAYWSFAGAIERAVEEPLTAPDAEVVGSLHDLLRDVVGQQMVSDVPLGAFLSGGIDSSTIVALMQSQSARPVKTFAIGFNEKAMDEAPYAREVARHLGTDHRELYVTSEDARGVIPMLPDIYDEPFADPSQIPTYLVSKLARTEVTVSLSGDAGDELFGGYNRYLWADSLWRGLRRFPRGVRRAAAATLAATPNAITATALSALQPLLPARFRAAGLADKVAKMPPLLRVDSPEGLYLHLVSQWRDAERVALGAAASPGAFAAMPVDPRTGFVEWMMAIDSVSYLPDDILVKVDRAAMAVSLESRVPFLDPRVVEFAWRLPLSTRIRDGRTKWPLRQVLRRYVPDALVERPKMGFGVPVGDWLRGPLRDWAEELLDAKRLEAEGYFDTRVVRAAWEAHRDGRQDRQYALWAVLMFQCWHDRWMASGAARVEAAG